MAEKLAMGIANCGRYWIVITQNVDEDPEMMKTALLKRLPPPLDFVNKFTMENLALIVYRGGPV